MTHLLVQFFLSTVLFLIYEWSLRGFVRFRRPIINRTEWKWIAVKDCDIPIEDYLTTLVITQLLVSDGEDVATISACTAEYDSKGNRVFSFHKKIITHWTYMPSAPENQTLKTISKDKNE